MPYFRHSSLIDARYSGSRDANADSWKSMLSMRSSWQVLMKSSTPMSRMLSELQPILIILPSLAAGGRARLDP